MYVLSIKVPIRKKSGNLSYAPIIDLVSFLREIDTREIILLVSDNYQLHIAHE